jgi:erythromycin esterase
MIKYRFFFFLFAGIFVLPAHAESSILGTWEGSLSTYGNYGIVTVIFRVSQDVLVTTATIEVPKQGLLSPVRILRPQRNEVVFELSGVGRYEGKISPDGNIITGYWKQQSMSTPMTLRLITKAKSDTRAITYWITKHLIPLKTVDPQNSLEDLKPFKTIIGNARIVSMGEATHGTREFFQLKHRLFHFLVEQMGFNVFALEANLPEARFLNSYVLGGNEDARKALDGLYSWPWKTEEVLELVEWMRAYNADPAHPKKVKFYGFDMQIPNMAAANVILYLQQADPKFAGKAVDLLSKVPITESERNAFAGSIEAPKVLEQILEIISHLDTLPQSQPGWNETRRDARILEQSARMMMAGERSILVRDEAMAENVQWILDQEGPEAKIMLWAHNGHVRTTMEENRMWMGSHLRKRYGNSLISMGFVFHQGSFRAMAPDQTPHTFIVPPAPLDSLDSVLAETKQTLFAIDLRKAIKPEIAGWFHAPQKAREIGAGYSEDMAFWMLEQPPAEAFDILLFVEKTTPTRPLSFK